MTEHIVTSLANTIAPENHSAKAVTLPEKPPEKQQETAPAGSLTESTGKWLHANPWFTKEPITYLGYQGVRAAASAVPYGFGMAGVHHLFGWMGTQGVRMGYNAEGLAKATKEGFAAVDLAKDLYKAGGKAQFGRNMARVANSPLNAAMQIAAAFTMFRFTGDLVKGLRDKVMDPNNTQADTIRELHNAGHTLRETATKNWPAESNATPYAALALGFMNSAFKQSTPYMKQQGENFGQAVKRVWSPDSKLLQNAAVWTLSYSVFFELSNRLFKDWQIRQGTWQGYPNSINRTPDSASGHPPGDIHINPEGKTGVIVDQGNAKDAAHKKPESHISDDPSLSRLVLRRIVPVALGISAYAALKRVGYVTVGGQMKAVNDTVLKSGAAGNAKTFLGNAWREGAATSMFFALWTFTDSMGGWFDKMFSQKEPATPQQQQNHEELLAKLNEKHQAQGRVA